MRFQHFTVTAVPWVWMQRSIIWPIFFLFTRKLTSYSNRLSLRAAVYKTRSCGIGALKMMRPAVVSTSLSASGAHLQRAAHLNGRLQGDNAAR